MTLEGSTDTDLIISWNPPDDGGGAQTKTLYDVSVNPGNQTWSVRSEIAVIPKLTSNTKYVVTVAAKGEDNILGLSSDNLSAVTCK